jgi:uncharacterized protein (UPF0332 family)
MSFTHERNERTAMDTHVDNTIKKAHQYLRSAAVLFELADYDSCVSRSYFSMMYVLQAALLTEGRTAARDSVQQALRDRFVDRGLVAEEVADTFDDLYEMQEVADFTLQMAYTERDAATALQLAEAFVNTIGSMAEAAV